MPQIERVLLVFTMRVRAIQAWQQDCAGSWRVQPAGAGSCWPGVSGLGS